HDCDGDWLRNLWFHRTPLRVRDANRCRDASSCVAAHWSRKETTMRVTRLLNPVGYRFGIATVAFAMFMPSLLHAKNEKPSTETLVRVRQTGTLKLGYYVNARPFS